MHHLYAPLVIFIYRYVLAKNEKEGQLEPLYCCSCELTMIGLIADYMQLFEGDFLFSHFTGVHKVKSLPVEHPHSDGVMI